MIDRIRWLLQIEQWPVLASKPNTVEFRRGVGVSPPVLGDLQSMG